MNFGEAWKEFMGECNKETAFGMLDFFYEQGGSKHIVAISLLSNTRFRG